MTIIRPITVNIRSKLFDGLAKPVKSIVTCAIVVNTSASKSADIAATFIAVVVVVVVVVENVDLASLPVYEVVVEVLRDNNPVDLKVGFCTKPRHTLSKFDSDISKTTITTKQ